MSRKFFTLFLLVIIVMCIANSQEYILTDIGKGIEKIEVELITPNPIYVQDFPDTKVYLIRFKRNGVDVAAGMSGSPLVKDGKIIGALFAGYSFQKEPIAFVLPIEYMDKIKEKYLNYNLKNDNLLSFSKTNYKNFIPLVINIPKDKINFELRENLDSMFSNFYFSYAGLESLITKNDEKKRDDKLKDNEKELKEGESISLALVDGDIKIFATGTLTKTYKDGYFTAFGHSFMNLGNFSAPVYKSKVISVINRYDDSFKLSSITDKKIGSIVFDTNYGILGKVGKEAQMIPLNIEILTNNKKMKNYSCFVVDDKNITYFLSLLSFYFVVSNYFEKDLPYEFFMEIGFANGRVQKIYLPSVNTSIESIIIKIYEYLGVIANIPSADNKLRFINFSINFVPQNLGIINNISIVSKEENNIKFGVNYYNPISKKNGLEIIDMVFPTESQNEDIYFAVGGKYDLPEMFRQLEIQGTTPKDFNQIITFVNFFYVGDPKYLLAVISTNLYGAINYNGEVIPLNTIQIYKYYLQYSMPFIYLSYYPIIIKRKMDIIPLGYDIFKINVNGAISKTEREKKEKINYSFLDFPKTKNENFEKILYKRKNTEVEKDIYEVLKDYFQQKNHSESNSNYKTESNGEPSEQKNEDSSQIDNSNIVNLSKYQDLIVGLQKNVSIDYHSNISLSYEAYYETIIPKNFFKIIKY
ncbi:MAG: hypothetical protein ACK4ZM_00810, partial [bacterium]